MASMQELIYRWRKRKRAEHSRIYILVVQQIMPNLVRMLTRDPDKEMVIIDTTHKSIHDTLKTLIQNVKCVGTRY